MAAEDTRAAAAAPEEELLQGNLTEAACGKGLDAASCGEGADAEASATPEAGASEAAAAGTAGAVDLAASGDVLGETGEGDVPAAAPEADDSSEAQQAEPTPEERELAENNALADVFDDVRRQSSDSQLVVPSRWVELGLIPGHMTSDEFEMLVYEYLEDYRRDHKDEIAAEKAERARKANSVRSATRAVGVPPKIPNRRLKQIEEDEKAAAEKAAREASEAEAGKAGLASGSAADKAAAPVAEVAPDQPADVATASESSASSQVMADSSVRADAMEAPVPHVSETASAAPEVPADPSADSSAADDGPFAGLKLPEGYKLVELEGEYVLVPDEDAAPVKKKIHCEHIVTLVGQHSYYLYDSDLMTKSYAHWAFLAAEDNPMATFVDCVREDGRIYPRPFAAEDLANPPFRMSASKVEDTWAELQKSGEYPDIERCEASNGDVYFFSTLYMDRTLAESLAEYRSVERLSNV
mgnify:FL=1